MAEQVCLIETPVLENLKPNVLELNHFQKHCFFCIMFSIFYAKYNGFLVSLPPSGSRLAPMHKVLTSGLVRTLRTSEMTPREAPVLNQSPVYLV